MIRNRKGIIFTITTLYFVAIFVLFATVAIYFINKPLSNNDFDNKYLNNQSKYLDDVSSNTMNEPNYVCTTHIVYDPQQGSEPLSKQSVFEDDYKIYCENYEQKRVV